MNLKSFTGDCDTSMPIRSFPMTTGILSTMTSAWFPSVAQQKFLKRVCTYRHRKKRGMSVVKIKKSGDNRLIYLTNSYPEEDHCQDCQV